MKSKKVGNVLIKKELLRKKLNFFVGLSFSFFGASVYAAEFEKYFEVKSDVSYYSNPQFLKTNKKSTFALRIEPDLKLSMTDELSKYYLNAGLSINENTNKDLLPNYVAPKLLAGWEREFSFAQFGLEATYYEVASRIEQLERTGVTSQVDNVTTYAQLKSMLNFEISENFLLKNDLVYDNIKYSESGTFTDYQLLGGGSKLLYKYSDRFSSYGHATFKNIRPDGTVLPESDVYSFVVGGVYTPSETLSIDANLGAYDASGRFSDKGVQGELTASYSQSRYSTYMKASRKMKPGGDGIFRLTEYIGAGGSYELGETQTVGVDYFSTKSQPDEAVSNFDVTYASLGVFYSKRYENWRGRIHANIIGLDLNGDQRYQNVIGFSLNYEPVKF